MIRRSSLVCAILLINPFVCLAFQPQDVPELVKCPACKKEFEVFRGSFLLVACDNRSARTHHHAQQYQPSEGDLIFFNSGTLAKQLAFCLTCSGGFSQPTHVGVVVKDRDGELKLLQALDPIFKGPVHRREGYEPGRVCMTPNILDHLKQYPGSVWIRAYHDTMTPAQSASLTAWARRQAGKPYAVQKLPLPTLGLPVQTLHLLGPARTEADSWHCSGLATASLIIMGHFDHWDLRPGFTDPEDLFSDMLVDLSPVWKSPVRWTPRVYRLRNIETHREQRPVTKRVQAR